MLLIAQLISIFILQWPCQCGADMSLLGLGGKLLPIESCVLSASHSPVRVVSNIGSGGMVKGSSFNLDTKSRLTRVHGKGLTVNRCRPTCFTGASSSPSLLSTTLSM